MELTLLKHRADKAVAAYWSIAQRQSAMQGASGQRGQGVRSAVTVGAQMDGFIKLLTELIEESGIKSQHTFRNTGAELPCFFRPSKKWDLVVVVNGKLVAAVLARSLSPNSTDAEFDRITDEALASSLEFWTAFREGGFGLSGKPWLGIVLHIAETTKPGRAIHLAPVQYGARQEFGCSSRTERAQILCHKLLRERHYDSALLLHSTRLPNRGVEVTEPDPGLGFGAFARPLQAVSSAYAE